MKLLPLETYLSEFLTTARQAEFNYQEAVAAEQYFEDATQDILHAAEFAPSTLASLNIPLILHDLRERRRSAKQELEGARIWREWAAENKKAVDKLDQVLGALRKTIRWKTNSSYRFKTPVVSPKDSYITPDAAEPEYEQMWIQLP